MRPVLALAALAALVMGFLAACTDDDPLRPQEQGAAAFSVRPQLNLFGASELLPINLIRLTVVSLPDSTEVMDPVEVPVSPADTLWNLHLDVPLAGGSLEVIVFVELINETDGVRTVEWSGVAGPFDLEPGATLEPPKVEMFRGSIADLAITSVAIAGADTTTEGATLVLRATATGAASPRFFWSSLDPSTLALDSAAADSATFLPLVPGIARVVVEAGPRVDTLEVTVVARITALDLAPTVDTITALLASSRFVATAFDARGDTVPDVAFTWTSSDTTIARHLGDGVFEAREQGSVVITATTPRAPGVSISADLTVDQVADTIAIFDASDTVAAGQTITLNAVAIDRNGQAIAPAPLAWTSDDTTIVSIDSTGTNAAFVSGHATGVTFVRAALDGVSGAIEVVVLSGAAATVVVTPPSLSFASLGTSSCLTATVTDAEGNPASTTPAWSSTDAAVVSVDAVGCVSAVGDGAAFVVATAGAAADSAAVSVGQVADSVDVLLADAQIAAGSTTTATGLAFDAAGAPIGGAVFAWSSSDAAVAAVDTAGNVTGLLAGSAWIRGAFGALTDSALVTVVPGVPASIAVLQGDAQTDTVAQPLADSLVVLVLDAQGNAVAGAAVDFSTTSGSLAPASATTDALGRAASQWTLGTVAGAAQARAAIAGDSALFAATVLRGPTAIVSVTPDSIAFASYAQTDTLAASGTDAYGNDCGCAPTWSSADTVVATVDAGGVVTPVTNGATWIVAQLEGVRDSARVTVQAGARAFAWVGGAPGAETEWFAAANWQPATVPAPIDSVVVAAGAAAYPLVTGPVSIASLVVEPGAFVDVGTDTLSVTGYLQADTIAGSGAIRLAHTEVRANQLDGVAHLPSLVAADSSYLFNRVSVAGDVRVEPATYLEVTFGGLDVSGDVLVAGDDAALGVFDSLLVAGALQVGGGESSSTAHLKNRASIVVGDSLLVTGRGVVEFGDSANAIGIGGNARWESTEAGEPWMSAGTIVVAGDWHMEGPSFHSPDLLVVFDGTAGAQNVTHLDAGHGAGQGHFGSVHVANPNGVVFLTPTLIHGTLDAEPGVAISADTLVVERDIVLAGDLSATQIVAGDVSVSGALTAGELRVSGALAVAGPYAVPTTEFTGAGQTIPVVSSYQDVLVSGSGTSTSAAPTSIPGNLAVTGSLKLQGEVEVGGITTVAGSVQLNGQRLGTPSIDVALGGLSLSNAADSLVVRGGSASFRLPSSSTLSGGNVVVEAGGNFTSEGKAFRSTGTVLTMYGDTLFMSDAGPGALQGALSTLRLGRPSTFTVIDSVYVTGDLVDVDSANVVDRGQIEGAPRYGEIRVEGDIATPRTGYTFAKLRLAGALDYGYAFSDLDSTQFTGTGQVIPVLEPGSFNPFPHSPSIIVTGADVHLGADTAFLDVSSDFVVRGAGARLTIHSNDNGFIRSLRITEGDATTRVVFHDGISIRDSVMVEAGVLDLGGQFVGVNDNGFATVALRTSGTGVIELNDSTDHLYVAGGNARFEGGDTEGYLAAGVLEMADSTTFYSRGGAFRSTGTGLVMRGDTIEMEDAGFGTGQGQLWDFQYLASEVEVVDSLYIANDLNDGEFSMLHDGADDALVRVAGDAKIDSSQVIVGHFAIAGALTLDPFMSNFGVGTAEFYGANQYVPVANGSPSYGRILITGTNAQIGSTGEYLGVLGSTDVVVSGAGASALLFSSDAGGPRSLVMDAGAASVALMTGIDVDSIVDIRSGVLDLNGFGLGANAARRAPVAFRTTGSGVLEMDQPGDALFVTGGDVVFEGASTNGRLTAGAIVLSSPDSTATSFHASGDAFYSSGTRARFDVDSIVIVNGGIGPTQTRFSVLEFGTQTGPFFAEQLVGHLVVADTLIDYISSGSDLVGATGSQLTVLGWFSTTIAGLSIPHITAYQNLQGASSSQVDLVELAGNGQVVGEELAMKPDTILVTGPAVTVFVDSMAFPADTLASVLEVRGMLFLASSGAAVVRDTVIVDGGTFDPQNAFVTVGDGTLGGGALVTRNGGLMRMASGGFVTVNGNVEFRGAATMGSLSAGTLTVRGDFYAENGAFQASGTHTVSLEGPRSGAFPTVRFATPGVGTGLDNFRNLRIATNTVTNIASDVYATGVLSGLSSTPATSVYGSASQVYTIFSDGWLLNQGDSITFNELTLELDASLDPLIDASAAINGLTFGTYTNGATRMRVRHPGNAGSAVMGLRDVNFNPSTSYPGIYVHAIDSDGASPDVLGVQMEQQTLSMPPDFDVPDGNRVLEENGAVISVQTT